MSLSLGYLNQKYIKISENVILVTIAREVDHIKEFLFFLFLMVQVLVAQGDFPPQITIHL